MELKTVAEAQALRAEFSEAAVPSSYVWETVLSDAYFVAVVFGVATSWSAADVYLKLALNGTVLVGDPDPPGANNWTVTGAPFYPSIDLINNISKAGDVLRFTLRSPGSTAAAGHAYFELAFISRARVDPAGVVAAPL